MATIDPTLREVLRSRLGREPTHKEMCDAATSLKPETYYQPGLYICGRRSVTTGTEEWFVADDVLPAGEFRAGPFASREVAGEALLEFLRRPAVMVERRACADIARNGCLVPPDGGAPTESERLMCDAIAAAILARG